MATSITKTYSVTVTFKYEGGGAITDSDLNVSVLRGEIKKGVEEACRIQKGDINAQPGTVSEI